MDYASWREKQEGNPFAHDYSLLSDTEDVLGRKKLVESLWSDSKRDCLVIWGPDGCGKHTTAAYFLSLIWDLDEPCQSLLLHGRDFDRDYGNLGVLEELLDKFLSECNDGKGYDFDGNKTRFPGSLDAFILIDEPMLYSKWEDLILYLHGKLREHRLAQREARLFLILLSREVFPLPAAMGARATMIQVRQPNRSQRISFVKACSSLDDYISADAIADRTEGMTFLQLRKALENCMLLCDDLTKEELEDFFASQTPILSPEEHHMRFEEGLPIALGELAKSFVNMIGSRPIVGGAAYGQAAVPEQTNNSKILTQSDIDARGENKRKELENLPPYKLAAAVLDKERIERINANGKIKIAV